MRSTKTKYKGLVALIESGSGLIVGDAKIVGCSKEPIPKSERLIKHHKVEDLNLLDKWKYAWYLKKARRYEQPIPYTHPQGAVIWVNL